MSSRPASAHKPRAAHKDEGVQVVQHFDAAVGTEYAAESLEEEVRPNLALFGVQGLQVSAFPQKDNVVKPLDPAGISYCHASWYAINPTNWSKTMYPSESGITWECLCCAKPSRRALESLE